MRVNPFLPGKARPLVVGHRGVPLAHQENTLAGFRKAIELGVPAVELDVRLTADGVAVLFHDDLVDRLTGAGGRVADLTWNQLSRLRIRKELHMGFGDDGSAVVVKYPREEPIARLDEVLSELKGKVAINVELKTPMPRWWSVEVGARTAEALKRAGMESDVILTSFDPRRLQLARKTCADLLVGFCFDDTMLDFACPILERLPPVASRLDGHSGVAPGGTRNARLMLNRLLDSHLLGRLLGMRVVGADHTLIGPDTVTSLHQRGVAVGTHTLFPIGSTTGKMLAPSASTAGEARRLVELGVDWIESDDPEKLMGVVHGN